MGHWLCTKPHWVPTERLHWGPTLTATQDIGQVEVPSWFSLCLKVRQDIYKLGIWSRAPCLSMFLALAFASPCFFPLRSRDVLQEEWLEQRRCRQYVLYSTQSFQWHYTCQRLRSLTFAQVSGWSKRNKCLLLKDWAKFLYFCCPSLPLTLGLGENTSEWCSVGQYVEEGEPSWGQEITSPAYVPYEREFWCARKQTALVHISSPAAVAFIQLIQTPWWHKFTPSHPATLSTSEEDEISMWTEKLNFCVLVVYFHVCVRYLSPKRWGSFLSIFSPINFPLLF